MALFEQIAIKVKTKKLKKMGFDDEFIEKNEMISWDDDEINYQIFGSRGVGSTEDIVSLQEGLDDKRIININTLVMKDYIDDLKRIKRMLDYVGDIGVYKNGFVSLMKCNHYSNEHFINFNDIFWSFGWEFLFRTSLL